MKLLLAIAASIVIFVGDGRSGLEERPIAVAIMFSIIAAAFYVNRNTGKKP